MEAEGSEVIERVRPAIGHVNEVMFLHPAFLLATVAVFIDVGALASVPEVELMLEVGRDALALAGGGGLSGLGFYPRG